MWSSSLSLIVNFDSIKYKYIFYGLGALLYGCSLGTSLVSVKQRKTAAEVQLKGMGLESPNQSKQNRF